VVWQPKKKKNEFTNNYITDYLRNFQNPHENVREYTDNIIRYLRLTKYVFIRGGGYYIDIESRRMIEIESILKQDNGAARQFTLDEYKRYISDYNAYILPFETVTSLTDIALGIIDENKKLAEGIGIDITPIEVPKTSDEIKKAISELRVKRNELQNMKIKYEYQNIMKINEVLNALSDLLDRKTRKANRPSVELEKWVNIALNILNDAILIKPNAPAGDDNEPTFTAPSGVPDIECLYEGFNAICEVTMITGRDQWYNEGQPVMRQLRSFEQVNNSNDNYCLFIAPRLHIDTINTFWNAVKYEYQGQRQKIVPITITKLMDILIAVRDVRASNKTFTKDDLRQLYDSCIDVSNVSDSTMWLEHINKTISMWSKAIV